MRPRQRSIFFALLIGLTVSVSPGKAELIHTFNSDIHCNRDGSMDVVEEINLDFEGTPDQSGFRRIIPARYEHESGGHDVDLEVQSVNFDRTDVPVKFDLSRHGHDYVLKIGDADKPLSGSHFYTIRYKVKNAIQLDSPVAKLFWNVTNDQNSMMIQRPTAVVHLPSPGIRLNDAEALWGPPGTVNLGTVEYEFDGARFSVPTIQAGEGFYISMSMPKDTFVKVTRLSRLQNWLSHWGAAVFLPLGTAFFMWLLRWNSGRNLNANETLSLVWNPPNSLSPAEVGTIVDDSCDPQDVMSTIVDLAVRRHFKIQEVEGTNVRGFTNVDFRFTKTEPSAGEVLSAHEADLIKAIFGGEARSGQQILLSSRPPVEVNLSVMKRLVYDTLIKRGIFESNPETVRTQYFAVGCAVMFVALVLPCALPLRLGIALSGVIIASFSSAMRANTRLGSDLKLRCMEFQHYIQSVSASTLRESAKGDARVFFKLLPYTISLGVQDEWASAFSGEVMEYPDWYHSLGKARPEASVSTLSFVHDLAAGIASMQTSLEIASREI